MTLPIALLLLACSSDSDGPPSFVVQPEPAPTPAPAPELPAEPAHSSPPATTVAVVFELGAPGGAPASDIGAQRIAIADGSSQWAVDRVVDVADSVYHERHPVAVSDGTGGLIAVFEAEVPDGPLKGDLDLFAQRVDADGKLLWGDGEQSVILAATEVVERAPLLLTDGQGGTFVIFERHGHDESGSLDSDLAAQRLGPDGALLWADGSQEGLPIAPGAGLVSSAVAAADGAGGLIVVFEIEATSGAHAGSSQLWAHRIAANGDPLWGSDGRPMVLAAAGGSISHAALLPDGSGGALVFFREEVVDGELAGDFDLMVQRVAPDGSLPWSGDPRAYKVASATTLIEGPPAVCTDGAGGAIVAFQAQWREGPRSGELDLFAQRIGPEGAGLWNQGMPVSLASSDWSEGDPSLVTDGAGGAIAVYPQQPPASHLSKDQDIYAQRIGPDGVLLWNQGEHSAVLSATTHFEQKISVVSDGAGGLVAFFEAVALQGEHTGDSELVAQRLDAAGQRLWGEGTAPRLVAWSPLMERNPRVVEP